MKPTTYSRLSLMMFLEYFVWGAWYVTLGTYLGATLNFSGLQISSVYGAGAIAAMLSPFLVGLIADRYFATERVLGVMHLLGAGLMYAASTATDFGTFYPFLLGYALCYMPTIALTNAVSFHQMNNPAQQFPSIRVWGTIGWIASGLMIFFIQTDISGFGLSWDFPFILKGTKSMDIEATAIPLQITAGLSLLMGLYSFSLPHTPPKGKGKAFSAREALGLDAIGLLKERNFLVLFVASILICIPLMFYYTFTNMFLNEVGFENAAGKMTLGQMSEIIFMLLMPLAFARLGVKKMMLIGMAAWAIRYVLFAFGDPEGLVWMFYIGILLHGICFDFFFVTGQIYAENRAPSSLRSSVQGMMTFATYGVGMFIGSLVSGPIVDLYAQGENAHSWKEIWLIPAVFAVLVMLVFWALFKEGQKETAASRVETGSSS
ncbi:MAG: MFS transporter [Bacteroidetes bacterium]|nr:MAG: MFS transporter [Bacteroidota bacterium]